jgi:hypothetical protein
MNKTVLVIGSMVSAMVLACMATVLTATPGGGNAGRRRRHRRMRLQARPQNGKACGQNTRNRIHPRRPRLP